MCIGCHKVKSFIIFEHAQVDFFGKLVRGRVGQGTSRLGTESVRG